MKTKMICLATVTVMLFTLFCGGTVSDADTFSAAAESGGKAVLTDGFEEVIRNGNYTLYYNSETNETALKVNETNLLWYSNPQNRASDSLADSQEKYNLNSQVILYYYNGEALSVMDSYSYGTALNQNTAVTDGDTLKVTYSLGEDKFSIDMLPQVISRTRMEKEILPELEEEDRQTLLNRYSLYSKAEMDKDSYEVVVLNFPAIADHDIYVRGQLPDYLGEELWLILQKAGYTLDDLQNDCDENQMENTYTPSAYFKLNLTYKLNDDGLTVECDPKEIQYNELYKPVRIEILPFFGAAGTGQQGYMLVPDGCGAVIDFNNGKLNADEYWRYLFGDDSAISAEETVAPRQELTLPVFALSNENGGFLASIDSGYENAGISADIAGKSNSYNNIFPFFTLFSSDKINISANNSDSNLFIVTSPEIFSSSISISYHFTSGYTSYDGFANLYRDLLLKNGILAQHTEQNRAAVNIEFIGTVGVKKKFLGFPYNTLEGVTTYQNAEQILKELGIDNVDIKFTNALSGGKWQKSASTVKISSALGNKKALEELKSVSGNISFAFYSVRQKSASKSKAAMSIGGEIVKVYEYDLISRLKDNGKSMVQLSAKLLDKNAESVIKSAKKNNIDALNILDIGYLLGSDFNSESPIDRSEARSEIQDYLKMLSSSIRISVERGSIFSLPYASDIWNIPISSSEYKIFDASVPFYSLVVRGLIPIITEPVNTADDMHTQFLKTVEIGGELQYSWYYSKAENIQDYTEDYYNRNYRDTINQARAYAQRLSELQDVIGQSMIIAHERAEADLICVTYECGVRVIINYGDKQVSFKGYAVPPRDYIILS